MSLICLLFILNFIILEINLKLVQSETLIWFWDNISTANYSPGEHRVAPGFLSKAFLPSTSPSSVRASTQIAVTGYPRQSYSGREFKRHVQDKTNMPSSPSWIWPRIFSFGIFPKKLNYLSVNIFIEVCIILVGVFLYVCIYRDVFLCMYVTYFALTATSF